MPDYMLDVRTVAPHFPGIGRYVRSLAQHLPRLLNDDENLILLSQSGCDFPEREAVSQSTQVRAVDSTASPFSLRQQWTIPHLLRQQAKDCGDVLYHSPYYLMPYRVAVPTVLTVYDTISLTHPRTVSARARLLFRITTMLALRASNRIITISDTTRRDLLAGFNVDPRVVTTVHLGVDDVFCARPNEAETFRNRRRLHGEFVLYFGSNKPHKNIVRLVDAYALLRTQWPSDTGRLPALVIAGAWDGRFPEGKRRAEFHGLGDHVRFLGPVDDVDLPALYSAAMAFVFPSLSEGFGLPVLEAMACGTPVASSNASSLPEVAGDAAFYFDPEDVESMAHALRALASDAALRATLTALGAVRAKAFSWHDTARKTLDIYRSLLN